MSLKGDRRAPTHSERSICAKAGSPKRRETQGDGILIVSGEEAQRRSPMPEKEQPSKEGENVPMIQGREAWHQEETKRRGMRNAIN
jgi:hypothetical protein